MASSRLAVAGQEVGWALSLPIKMMGITHMALSLQSSTETGAISNTVRRGLVFVLLPALIAGFFSILPKLYDVLVKERTALSYQWVSGPAMPLTDGFRRIFAIGLQNTGKIPLTHIVMEARSQTGNIESMVAEKSILHPAISQDLSTVTVERMLPGERVNLSAMVKSNSTEPSIDLRARSDEAVAVSQNLEQRDSYSGTLAVVGAALSAISVGAMSALFLSRRGSSVLGGDKADIITFIAGVSTIIPMSESILLTEHDMSYARLADVFLFTGLKGDEEIKRRCVAGLIAIC
jgi:hypothetical protein